MAETRDTIASEARPRCRLCSAAGIHLYEDLRDVLFEAPGRWRLVRCPGSGCGLVWLDPMPAARDLGQAYRGYYTHAADREGGRARPATGLRTMLLRVGDSLAKRATGLRAARAELDDLFLGAGHGRRLLEIGCGSGERLVRWQAAGWTVTGQDVDARAVRASRERTGAPVEDGELTALGLPASSFDAVVGNHVIEHVPDPVSCLKECARLLAPGGRLVVTTPNPEGFGHRLFGRDWMGLDPPRHLHLFPPAALQRLAAMAGLEGAQVTTSAARGLSFARGSVEIRALGRHDMRRGRRLGPALEWKALVFQYRAWARERRGLGDGEECVLLTQGERS